MIPKSNLTLLLSVIISLIEDQHRHTEARLISACFVHLFICTFGALRTSIQFYKKIFSFLRKTLYFVKGNKLRGGSNAISLLFCSSMVNAKMWNSMPNNFLFFSLSSPEPNRRAIPSHSRKYLCQSETSNARRHDSLDPRLNTRVTSRPKFGKLDHSFKIMISLMFSAFELA